MSKTASGEKRKRERDAAGINKISTTNTFKNYMMLMISKILKVPTNKTPGSHA